MVSGGGHMTEDRVDLRATCHLSLGTLTAGGQAIRFAGDHDYLDSDLEDILPPLVLRDRQWRIGAFANIDAPLGRTWRTRAGVRLDRFAGVANTFAPFAELSYAGAWWEARISAARSYQTLASLRNEESIGASLLAYDLMVPIERGPVPRNTEISAGWEGRGAPGACGSMPTPGRWRTSGCPRCRRSRSRRGCSGTPRCAWWAAVR